LVFHRVISYRPPNEEVTPAALTGDPLAQRAMFLRCNFEPPSSAPEGFDLVVPGRVSRFITKESLDSYRDVEIDLVLECAGNGRSLMEPVPAGTPWGLGGVSPMTVRGVKLADVLGGLPESVREVVFTGADRGVVEPEGEVNYQFSISREMALSRIPILVTHIAGESLTLQHGAPIRLIVPGQYAMKSVKWLTRVEAVTYPFLGHFMLEYRYVDDTTAGDGAAVGEIAVRSVISRPIDGEGVPAGPLDIRGSAWSGSGEVASVEVSTDDGDSWVEADLIQRETGGRWAAIQWSAAVDVEPGETRVMARATDSTGATQPLETRWNKGGYANNVVHRVNIEVLDLDEEPED
jgi:DMSO/TMAO reductase YedYZ molybdopterin-dependent catalytic subunit